MWLRATELRIQSVNLQTCLSINLSGAFTEGVRSLPVWFQKLAACRTFLARLCCPAALKNKTSTVQRQNRHSWFTSFHWKCFKIVYAIKWLSHSNVEDFLFWRTSIKWSENMMQAQMYKTDCSLMWDILKYWFWRELHSRQICWDFSFCYHS